MLALDPRLELAQLREKGNIYGNHRLYISLVLSTTDLSNVHNNLMKEALDIQLIKEEIETLTFK